MPDWVSFPSNILFPALPSSSTVSTWLWPASERPWLTCNRLNVHTQLQAHTWKKMRKINRLHLTHTNNWESAETLSNIFLFVAASLSVKEKEQIFIPHLFVENVSCTVSAVNQERLCVELPSAGNFNQNTRLGIPPGASRAWGCEDVVGSPGRRSFPIEITNNVIYCAWHSGGCCFKEVFACNEPYQ